MDFMYIFPPEILEIILSFVSASDLKSCIQVSQTWRRNVNDLCNWKRICIDNEWFPEELVEYEKRSDWKKCFWLNFNWYNCFYDVFNLQVCPLSKIHLTKDLVVRVFQNRVEIWSFNVIPRLEQTLSFSHLYRSSVKVYNDFIVNQQNSYLQIFNRHYRTKTYRLFKEISLPSVPMLNFKKKSDNQVIKETIVSIKLSEQYIAVTFKGNENIYAWSLEDPDVWMTAHNADHIFQMEVETNMLFIIILDMSMSCYKVRGFDLDERLWDFELILVDNTPFGVNPPELWVNSWFIMSIAEIYQFQNRYLYTPLKVWNREGRFVALEFPNCARQPYFQCCLKENLVIFTINESTVAVWEPHAEVVTKTFAVERGYHDMRMVPGNLVAISYTNLLQFWDWKLGILLHTVDFKLRVVTRPIVNEQYFVYEDIEDIIVMKYHDLCKIYPP